MLSKELEMTLNHAFKEAREKRHEFMTVEHLLLALLDNSQASHVLRACGANIERLKQELRVFVDETTPIIPSQEINRQTQPTLGFQRVLQRAVFHVQSAGKEEVSGANVLAAIFSEQESQAIFFLKQENVTRLDVINYISHGIAKTEEKLQPHHHHHPHPEESDFDGSIEREQESEAFGQEVVSRSPLESYAVNLNLQAKLGKVDPLVGREQEVERTIQILCRRRKNNPLFVGEAGVGKTALAEGLAKAIVDNKVPDTLKHCTVYALDLGSLLAGTKYRGDFEKRFKALLSALQKDTGSILFIDEIHTIIGAGAASGGVMDASNLIKPTLANGKLRCMGSTTYQEYRGIFEKDRALARRFQKVDVKEPTSDETIKILQGLKSHLESHHGVRYNDAAIEAAVTLSIRYINDRFLPDKAIDVVDEAGAYQRLLPVSKRKKWIGVKEIESIVAKMAQIPSQTVSTSDRHILKTLDDQLKLAIFGQDEAIHVLSDAVKMGRSGLKDPQRPIGCFLFAGPTGVGKTEVTRQLAKHMGVELVRFDMSEYMESHTVSRLIGAPPGYVGFDNGGLLTEAVNKHPHCVLLLDEIEKAHPEVFNLLLQVMDHGTLTDTNGRKADFKHVILVMTTNAGADVLSRSSIGFKEQEHTHDGKQVLEKLFTPEFRNRLDAVVQFKALTPDVIDHVVDKFIDELAEKLLAKNVTLQISDEAKHWLAVNGYDRKMGARPMGRLIQEKLKKPLADELLFGDLSEGGSVFVDLKDEEFKMIFKSKKERSESFEPEESD